MSETLAEVKTEKVSIILSRYSSLIFKIRGVPIKEPMNGTIEILKIKHIERKINPQNA